MILKELIKFGMEESQEPVIKNPILRQALEPRTMDQASLQDDVVPGRLKDELEGKFDPDQETYEEYLRRKRLGERPFNMSQGGRSGFPKGGFVKPLSPELQKLFDKTNPGEKWGKGKFASFRARGNWKNDAPRKQKILKATSNLITEEKLAEILTEELGEEITRAKIFGKYGVGQRTKFAETIDNLLFKGKFGSIKGGKDAGGSVRYFKKPSKNDIKKILKSGTLSDVRINNLRPNTVKNILHLNKKFRDIYQAGNIPDIEDVMKGTKMTEQSAGTATARLAQIYNGHKFRNKELEGIRVNKKTADSMFEIMNNSPFGNPYRNGLYKASMQTIDTALGNKTGTFEGLKKKAKQILIDNKIPIYSPEIKDSKGKVIRKAKSGFNINEIAGVTGSAKSKNVAVSQFIDIMEGNLNQKTLANFQGQLSIARQNIEGDKSLLSSESKRINKLARKLEREYDVKLPRLADPDALKHLSTAQIKRLESQTLGTGEDLYTRLVKDAERSGYSVKMPKGAITVQEFTQLDNKKLLKFFKDAKIPCIKGEGAQCNSIADYQKGYNKLVQEGAEGSKAAITKLGRFTKGMRALTGAAKWTGYGLLAEAGFMVPFAIGDYAAGESWKRILGNATDYGFGPIFGQSEQEEFEAALPEGSAAPQRRKVYELGERLDRFENQPFMPQGRIGMDKKRREESAQKVYDSILDEYILNMQPFLRTSPHLEESRYYDQYLMDKAEQEDIATMKKLEEERQARIDERTERGIIADKNWQSQVSYAGGGIAGIRRPNAIPPESGPTPQGLPSMLNRVKRI